MLDTGSAIDGTSCVANAKAHRISQPAAIDTGAGQARVDSAIMTHLEEIGEDVEAAILPGASITTKILTIGRRCAELGYGFYWHPWSSKPEFVKPSGDACKVECDADYVPYLKSASRSAGPNARKVLVGSIVDADRQDASTPCVPTGGTDDFFDIVTPVPNAWPSNSTTCCTNPLTSSTFRRCFMNLKIL